MPENARLDLIRIAQLSAAPKRGHPSQLSVGPAPNFFYSCCGLPTTAAHAGAPNIMATTTTSTSTSTSTLRPRKSFANIRALRRPRLAASTSTPDLNAAFSAHSRLAGALSRKTSLAALNATTLASIPDVSETYALDSVLSHDDNMIPATPGRPGAGGDDVVVGDTVEVPGGMQGTVRFVGAVQGKKGQFVGIELSREFAPRGKNNGDVDG